MEVGADERLVRAGWLTKQGGMVRFVKFDLEVATCIFNLYYLFFF